MDNIRMHSAEEMVATITATWETLHSMDMLNVLNMKILFTISMIERDKLVPFRRTVSELSMTQLRTVTRSFNSLLEHGFVYRLTNSGCLTYYLTPKGEDVVSAYGKVYADELARVNKVVKLINERRGKNIKYLYRGYPQKREGFIFRDKPIPRAYNLNAWEQQKKKFNRQNLRIKWKNQKDEQG